ncbi:hypothetical protein A9C19_03480 [Bacillus weihaiensis]|uniref:DUF2651 domain-containing protein n=2 Tax=Bacillus weihaiensis TaxID=1547283 RepID=A0A1L3MNI7_9BACI|nr:hypothetical protein A9C19_03480 [Bacillus weihaiensis]
MEFLVIMIFFPIGVILLTLLGFYLTKKSYVTPSLIFVLFAFIMLLFFNESFFIWVVIYTILSIVTTLLVLFIKKLLKK